MVKSSNGNITLRIKEEYCFKNNIGFGTVYITSIHQSMYLFRFWIEDNIPYVSYNVSTVTNAGSSKVTISLLGYNN